MSGPSRIRLRFGLRRAIAHRKSRSWRCLVAFGDEPLGLHRNRPMGAFFGDENFIDDMNDWEESYSEITVSDEWPGSTTIQEQAPLRYRHSPMGQSRVPSTDPHLFGSNSESRDSRSTQGVFFASTKWSRRGFASLALFSDGNHKIDETSSEAKNQETTQSQEIPVTPPFPHKIDQIAPEWLTEVLMKSKSSGFKGQISGFRVQKLGEGVGLMSSLFRLHLDYSIKSGTLVSPDLNPKTIILKFSSPVEEVRNLAMVNCSYEREVGFYKMISGFRASQNLPFPLKTPAVHFAEFHKPSGEMLIVMEDLANCRHLDQLVGATSAQAAQVVKDAARSHAAFLPLLHSPSPHLPLTPPWLPPRLNSPLVQNFDSGEYPASWQVFLPHLRSILDSLGGNKGEDLMQIVEKLGNLYHFSEGLLRRLGGDEGESIGETLGEKGRKVVRPITVLHGDLRLDNVFQVSFDQSQAASWQSSQDLVHLKYMDFGDCAIGRGVADVAYFLSQSLPISVRKTEEKSLLDLYFYTFLESAESQGFLVKYSREDLFEDYRTAVLYYWILAVNIWGHLEKSPEKEEEILQILRGSPEKFQGKGNRVDHLAMATTRRSLSALLDLNCLKLIN